MDILYINPVFSRIWNDHFEALLNAHKATDTTVTVRHLDDPDAEEYPFLSRKPFYYRSLFETIDANEQRFDACIIGCCADPGVRDAQYMARIPVLGPLQAAIHVAPLVGRKLAIMLPAHRGKRDRPLSWHREAIRSYGFNESRFCFRLVEVEKPGEAVVKEATAQRTWSVVQDEIHHHFQSAIETDGFVQAKRALEEDGADVLFFACTLWGGKLASLADLGVPVLDPVVTPLKTAEISLSAILTNRAIPASAQRAPCRHRRHPRRP